MPDREKVKKRLHQHCECSLFDRCGECPYYEFSDEQFSCRDRLLEDALALLKEQEKLVDVDALREKLGLAKDCEECKQNTRACQYDSHFSLMDFCERFDMAIEELKQEGR